jgi:hypothetical protein
MIVVKEETQIDLTSDGDGQSNDDPFRGLPMGERQQMLKKKRQVSRGRSCRFRKR